LATTFDRAAPGAPEALFARAAALLQRVGAAGPPRLLLDAHLGDGGNERLDALIALVETRRGEVPITAIEDRSGLARAPALAALDREEARAAIAAAEATLRRATAVGAPYVVLRLGWVEGARRDWVYARDRFLRARLTPALAQQLRESRDHAAEAQLDRARAALDRLARSAERAGVTLLVKNGQRYVELPSPVELDRLRADLRGAPLLPLLDLPAAHLTDRMQIWPLPLVEAAFGGGPLVYAGDACGALAALPPGDGEIGVEGVAAQLARQPEAVRAFRPWPGLTDAEIARGVAGLTGR
jgi:sugar phosphate isomerase/epimerase